MCFLDFETWYKKTFLLPEEELEITMDKTPPQVSLFDTYAYQSYTQKFKEDPQITYFDFWEKYIKTPKSDRHYQWAIQMLMHC